jgi:hypothetical protein
VSRAPAEAALTGPLGAANPGAPPKLAVRPTAPGDLDAVTRLLSERDGHSLARGHVSIALQGLEPAQLAGWMALADGEPAGLTTLYVREQRWGQRTIRAGYWSHLFVPERFRRLMVYPQLVLAMMRGIKGLGIDAIFTGTRRAHVAEGHVKLGFAKLGELGVLFKPLRPFRLVARYKGLPGAASVLAAPGDATYGAWLALSRGGGDAGLRIREVSRESAELGRVADILNELGANRVSQVWTVESLRRRLAGTIDGRGYAVLVAERGGRLVGALVYGLAQRDRVEAAIIMDVAATPGENHVAKALLGEAEKRVRAAGADTTLYLDGLGPQTAELLRERGHRASSETYQMLVWPKTLVAAGTLAADLGHWRFGFLDHDAF